MSLLTVSYAERAPGRQTSSVRERKAPRTSSWIRPESRSGARLSPAHPAADRFHRHAQLLGAAASESGPRRRRVETTSSRRTWPGARRSPPGRRYVPGPRPPSGHRVAGVEHVDLTRSGKMGRKTWIRRSVGRAASSRAREDGPRLTFLFPLLSVSGDSARQVADETRIPGIQEGRAGKVWDSTTTGTTSITPLPGPRLLDRTSPRTAVLVVHSRLPHAARPARRRPASTWRRAPRRNP